MAFPLSQSLVETAFRTLMDDMANLRGFALFVQSGTNGGASVSSSAVLNLANACIAFNTDWTAISGNSAVMTQLPSYAQQQLGNASLNVAAEFANVQTLVNALLTALVTDFPHDAQGHLLDRTFSTVTGLSIITFNAAALSHVLPAITNLLAEFT